MSRTTTAAAASNELRPHPAEVGAGQARPRDRIRHLVGHLPVQQEQEGGNGGQCELCQYPVVAEQPPGGAQGLDETGQQ
ncbi:hypothetical protein G5C60_09335 [Streptomyces sp. HC44]|uniref:Uncharacterized protein n=1 Tax=Streptomyces scabichelini TaxID=2711217 RepID=A0A6G4V1C4_9ACTN|nr:hypothetical protein [Streptomyces scabichelini]NGO07848.1 hypothetical protein [Streptomyces scabichelini]